MVRVLFAVFFLAVDGAAGAKLAMAGSLIEVDDPPPPPRIERVARRDGYIWVPGYWDWYRAGFHWTTGSYVIERRRARWAPDRWEQMGSRLRLVRGHWIHCCCATCDEFC